MPKYSILFMVALATTAFSQSSTAEAEIRAIRLRSNQALATHNIDAFADSLAPNFVMVRGNGALVPSRREYIELFARDFADKQATRYERVADKIEASATLPLAAEHGHWIGTRPDGTKVYGGTYLAMWKHAPSGWKIRSELFVTLWCGDKAACEDYFKAAAE